MRNETSIMRLPASGSENYEAKLLTLFEELESSGKVESGDAFTEAWIVHDRWCAALHGDGRACNCNPAIEISVREIGSGTPA